MPAEDRAPKVSVVIPTYSPGDRLDGLVHSLEAQTLPAHDFEVIFVDDGSPDDTWSRLERIRDTHSNVRIERIENSGWPSRPRNVGLDLARGEYVLFMDHDDELYPRALQAGYAMASRTQADVLNGKETRTDQPKWALEVYPANIDNAISRQDIHPLIPTNPHKLFRREFLLRHAIRFPEGGRVLWEDVFFNLDVARQAQVISVLADTPFYHWVRRGRTASSSYTENLTEYWRWVREIVFQTNEKLDRPELRDQWRLMLLHQYRSRILAPLGTALFKISADEFAIVRATVDDLIRNLIPDCLDAYLTPTQLGRAALVRAGRWDLLKKLVPVDSGLLGLSTATSVQWTDGTLRIAAESRWRSAGDTPLAIRQDGGRIIRDLPDDVAEVLPAEALDMTAALASARTSFGIRARDTGVSWMIPSESESRIEFSDGRPELVVRANGVLDPRTAVFGRPLDAPSWDVTARNEFSGAINQRSLRSTLQACGAFRGGHIYIAYANKKGMLSLDVDQQNRSLTGSAPLEPSRALSSVSRSRRLWSPSRPWDVSLKIPFGRRIATTDESVIEGSITVGEGQPSPARMVARPDGVWLEAEVAVPRGSHPLQLRFHGRSLDAGVVMTVGSRGEVSLNRRPESRGG